MVENSKSRPGEFDALEKARPDELIFPLLERDSCAPAAILHWCDLRRKRAFAELEGDALRDELRQMTDAEMIAHAMIAKQRGQDKESARATRPTYSGIISEKNPADELKAKLRAELAEADYHSNNALEIACRAHGLGAIDDAQLGHINDCARVSHAIALEFSPHRAALLKDKQP